MLRDFCWHFQFAFLLLKTGSSVFGFLHCLPVVTIMSKITLFQRKLNEIYNYSNSDKISWYQVFTVACYVLIKYHLHNL